MGPQPLVHRGVGLGTTACPPADSTPGKPALAANSSPKARYLESWGVSLSPSPVALAGLRPDLSSGPARVGIQVDSLHASQPSQQSSSQLRPTRLTASLDGPLKGSQTALVTAAATATNSAIGVASYKKIALLFWQCILEGAKGCKWLGRDVVESQLLGRGVRRGNSTQNHALSGCARLIRLVLRCLLSPTTRDNFAASEGRIWRCEAAEDGVSRRSLQRSAKTCFF